MKTDMSLFMFYPLFIYSMSQDIIHFEYLTMYITIFLNNWKWNKGTKTNVKRKGIYIYIECDVH